MLTVKEVAAELGVSATCVYQLVATGKLPCHRIGVGRGAIRVCEADLADFIASCRQDRRAQPAPEVARRGKPRFKHLRFEG